jgi:hypothetical protein
MRFEIDTKNKTIEIKEDVIFCELVQELNDLLDRDWENYTLIVNKSKIERIANLPNYMPPNPNVPYTDPDNPYKITC